MNLPPFLKKIFPIIFILLVATASIFWDLGKAPPGVLVDEASLGYNAYSVLLTGRDEWGNFLPLTLRSFGDYKPAGYIYFAIPFIKLFGLSPFSIRLPSVIAGLFTIMLIYLIINKLTRIPSLAIISSFILAVSPWFIFIHRMAWEPNISLALFLAGLYFLINNKKRSLYLVVAALFFSLSTNVYVPYKIYTPLLVFSFLIFLFIKKTIVKKQMMFFIILLIIFSAPFIYETLFKKADSRFKQVSILFAQGIPMYIDEQRSFCGMQKNRQLLSLCYLIWNKPVIITKTYLINYLSGFSSDFLFLEGDKAEFVNIPGVGGLYFWLLPFYFYGLVSLIINKDKNNYKFIIIWLLLAPLVPALANKPHYIRANMILIPTVIVVSIGLRHFIENINFKFRKLFIVLVISLFFSNLTITMVDYFFVYTKKAMAWDEYYLDIYKYLQRVDKDYDVIFIKKFNKQPYIYQLFYQTIDPEFFRNNVIRDKFEVLSVGKYKYIEGDFKATFCLWKKNPQLRTIYVTNEIKETYDPLLVISSFNKVHSLAAIYDFERTENLLKSKEIDTIVCK